MTSVSPLEVSASQTRWSYDPKARRPDSNEDNFRYDFITFLETCQNLDIDFLPITWQPALDALGAGGQSEVRQSLVSLAISFAFNRVKPPERKTKTERGQEGKEESEGKIQKRQEGEEEGEDENEGYEEKEEENEENVYRALVSQASILRLAEIYNYPNIIHLIGVCWDIRASAQEKDHLENAIKGPQLRVWPVLVVEKTDHGDLKCFVNAAGKNLSFTGRLKLCIDIASGILCLHQNRKRVKNAENMCLTCVWKVSFMEISNPIIFLYLKMSLELTQQRLQILDGQFNFLAMTTTGICHGPYLGKLRNGMSVDTCSLR